MQAPFGGAVGAVDRLEQGRGSAHQPGRRLDLPLRCDSRSRGFQRPANQFRETELLGKDEALSNPRQGFFLLTELKHRRGGIRKSNESNESDDLAILGAGERQGFLRQCLRAPIVAQRERDISEVAYRTRTAQSHLTSDDYGLLKKPGRTLEVFFGDRCFSQFVERSGHALEIPDLLSQGEALLTESARATDVSLNPEVIGSHCQHLDAQSRMVVTGVTERRLDVLTPLSKMASHVPEVVERKNEPQLALEFSCTRKA